MFSFFPSLIPAFLLGKTRTTLCRGAENTRKNGKKWWKSLTLKGFMLSVFLSVCFPFAFRFPFRFCPLRKSLWAGVRACFPQTLPLSQLLLSYPTGRTCRVRHGGVLRGQFPAGLSYPKNLTVKLLVVKLL